MDKIKGKGLIEQKREDQVRANVEARAMLDRAYYEADALRNPLPHMFTREPGPIMTGPFESYPAHKESPMKNLTITLTEIDNGILVSLNLETSYLGRGGGPMVFADDMEGALQKAGELAREAWGRPSPEKDCEPEEGNIAYADETMARDVPVMSTKGFGQRKSLDGEAAADDS